MTATEKMMPAHAQFAAYSGSPRAAPRAAPPVALRSPGGSAAAPVAAPLAASRGPVALTPSGTPPSTL